MELSILAAEASRIAFWAIDKASSGALGKAGADVLLFLKTKFQDKLQINQSDPQILESVILNEAQLNSQFQEDLQRLVNYYHQIQNSPNISQHTESGVNINLGSNSGTFVGQQIEQKFFR